MRFRARPVISRSGYPHAASGGLPQPDRTETGALNIRFTGGLPRGTKGGSSCSRRFPVSGRLLQFKPLVAGGIINWVLACVCVLVPYDYQLLIAAAAILSSYIIPGHLISSNKS